MAYSNGSICVVDAESGRKLVETDCQRTGVSSIRWVTSISNSEVDAAARTIYADRADLFTSREESDPRYQSVDG